MVGSFKNFDTVKCKLIPTFFPSSDMGVWAHAEDKEHCVGGADQVNNDGESFSYFLSPLELTAGNTVHLLFEPLRKSPAVILLCCPAANESVCD